MKMHISYPFQTLKYKKSKKKSLAAFLLFWYGISEKICNAASTLGGSNKKIKSILIIKRHISYLSQTLKN